MNVDRLDPPREFRPTPGVVVHDCGSVTLQAGEQVTFRTEGGGEHDVVRTEWGFYATGSLNGRLPRHGLRPVLVRNGSGRLYLLLVERGREPAFDAYRDAQGLEIVAWLDDARAISAIASAVASAAEGGAPPR